MTDIVTMPGGTAHPPDPKIPKPVPVPGPALRVLPPRTQIDIINHATNVSDAEAARVVASLQVQADLHFAPVWGVSCDLHYVGLGKLGSAKHWWLGLFDNADQAGALGYHDLSDAGLPLGKVFVETTKRSGGQWSCTASHELLEMLADPWINVLVFLEAGFARGTGDAHLVGYEVCDPCEDDSQGYKIVDVLVSDFVYPSYFEAGAGRPPYDYRGLISRPFQILANGYLGILPIGKPGGWTQINGRKIVVGSFPNRANVTEAVSVNLYDSAALLEVLPGPTPYASRAVDGSRRRKRQQTWAGIEMAPSVALSKS